MIASTYKLIEKLGSGGGGNVYLAEHIRLKKKVVLKVDKRKLKVSQALLRREVDILKELSHPFIPRVYDFFVEGEDVYTVMDHIEGESLDKALKRGERFSQPQVIRWACQLLDALCYLHSPVHGDPPRGFVHSDIKPSNLMRTVQGDICLIDFNIALALGEENVIGCSAGYASPEHYGLDFSVEDENDIDEPGGQESDITVTLPRSSGESSGYGFKASSGYHSGTSGGRIINPDVRSDIYSAGATLYHLLDGNRPSKSAKKVVPLSDKKFSPQIVRIISKAMNPNPDLRYQTAEEMRADFLNLRKNDPRMRRWKRQRFLASIVCSLFFAAGGAAAFMGLQRMQEMEQWMNRMENCRKALGSGDAEAAVKDSLDILSESLGQCWPEHVPGVQKVLTEALGVYDLSDGYKPYKILELPSPPLYLTLAPDGQKGAALCGQSVNIFDTVSGKILAELPAERSALSEIKFLDNNTVLYAGDGGIKAYDIQTEAELWSGKPAVSISVSGDGSCAAGIEEGGTSAAVYDTLTGEVRCQVDFEGRSQDIAIGNNLFALKHDGSWMGVSFQDGSVHMYDLEHPGQEIIAFHTGSEYTHFEGGFYDKYFAFAASDQEKSTFAVIDMDNEQEAGGFESETAFRVRTDENGIYVQSDHILVKIDPATGEQTPLVTMTERILCFAGCENHTVAASESGIYFFDKTARLVTFCKEEERNDFACISDTAAVIGSMDKPTVRIMRYQEDPDAEIFLYDSDYKHDEARISSDEKTVMLFSYDQFRIYGKDGSLIQETLLPEPAHVSDQQFIREDGGSFLKVTYDNEKVLVYSAESGELLKEESGDKTSGELPGEESGSKPIGELDEEFVIGHIRIESPLHGTPVVYDLETGEEIARLKEDTYLTYVTQAGEYLVTQYIAADGYRSGQLLNEDCEVLAELPYLTDVVGDTLIFDHPAGSIRRSQIYSIEELMDMANE